MIPSRPQFQSTPLYETSFGETDNFYRHRLPSILSTPPTSTTLQWHSSSFGLIRSTVVDDDHRLLPIDSIIDKSIPPFVEIGPRLQGRRQRQQQSTVDGREGGDDSITNNLYDKVGPSCTAGFPQSATGSNSRDLAKVPCPGIAASKLSCGDDALVRWTASPHVPVVPQYAPLERTALRVNGPPLEAILGQITLFMKMNSICCVYHSTEARVDCLTCWGLKFVVQLWKDNPASTVDPTVPQCCISSQDDNTATHDSIVIIECQRRRGCCVAMRNVRKQLYRAILALSDTHRHHHHQDNGVKWGSQQHCWKSYKDTILSRRVQTVSKQLSARLWGQPSHPIVNKTIHSISRRMNACQEEHLANIGYCCLMELFEGNKIDDNRMGMDMLLLALTNPDRVGGCVSTELARGLAFGEPPRGCRLRKGYMKFFRPASLLSKRLSNGVDCSDSQDVSALDAGSSPPLGGNNSYDLQEIHLISLKVMRTCIDRIIEIEHDYLSNEAMMVNLSSDFWIDTLEIFIVHLEDSSTRPQEASISTGCLYRLETLQPFLLGPSRRRWTIEVVLPLLRTAHAFGVQHHLLLQEETRILIDYIEVRPLKEVKGDNSSDDVCVVVW
jgi:hypothetical protein